MGVSVVSIKEIRSDPRKGKEGRWRRWWSRGERGGGRRFGFLNRLGFVPGNEERRLVCEREVSPEEGETDAKRVSERRTFASESGGSLKGGREGGEERGKDQTRLVSHD